MSNEVSLPKPVRFDAHVKGLFSDEQRNCMLVQGGWDLHKLEDVKLWHKRIVAKLSDGSMPEGGPRWPPERIAIIKQWKEDNFQP